MNLNKEKLIRIIKHRADPSRLTKLYSNNAARIMNTRPHVFGKSEALINLPPTSRRDVHAPRILVANTMAKIAELYLEQTEQGKNPKVRDIALEYLKTVKSRGDKYACLYTRNIRRNRNPGIARLPTIASPPENSNE
eukprot:398437-Pleurochrysis_carterae.AAC.1